VNRAHQTGPDPSVAPNAEGDNISIMKSFAAMSDCSRTYFSLEKGSQAARALEQVQGSPTGEALQGLRDRALL
jgi:hypothetical protein